MKQLIDTCGNDVTTQKFDYIIVGAGLSGAVAGNLLSETGSRVLIIDKRPHTAGNCFTKKQYDIDVHKYGAHIFRTDKSWVWEFVNSFGKFDIYNHKVRVNYDAKVYSFPINLETLNQVFKRTFTPETAKKFIADRRIPYVKDFTVDNLENYCISLIGHELYNIFIKGYTEKQWGTRCDELPSSIIKRIPVRFNYNDSYFADEKQYQGIPRNGYTELIDRMMSNCNVILNVDYLKYQSQIDAMLDSSKSKIIYCGCLDEYFNYDMGELGWRSLEFAECVSYKTDEQGVSVMNYTKNDISYTRIIEHKHFNRYNDGFARKESVITYEYPKDWKRGTIPYYPINNDANNALQQKYIDRLPEHVLPLGRLAEYKYFDMDVAIENAFNFVNKHTNI